MSFLLYKFQKKIQSSSSIKSYVVLCFWIAWVTLRNYCETLHSQLECVVQISKIYTIFQNKIFQFKFNIHQEPLQELLQNLVIMASDNNLQYIQTFQKVLTPKSPNTFYYNLLCA